MVSDPIADLLTRIRNAAAVRKRIVEIPASKIKLEIVKVLHEMGYILNYKFVDAKPQGVIKVALKYDSITKESAFTRMVRVSRPGLRKYVPADDIPRVMNGLGVAILSTSKGVLTGKQARLANVGGEVLCYVY